MPYSRTIKIMIAEDEAVFLKHIVKKVEGIDPLYRVIATAGGALEALDKMKTAKPDLLITDLKMPGMSGMDLIQAAKALFPDLPIIILSGYSDFSYAQQAIKFGVDNYLLKPLCQEDLENAMYRAKEKIYATYASFERAEIIKTVQGERPDAKPSAFLEGANFCCLLICIGNLYDHFLSMKYSQSFHEIWKTMDWKSLLQPFNGTVSSWWLVDENVSNQKCLLLDLRDGVDVPALATSIHEQINEWVKGYPVSISISTATCRYSELWTIAQKLRTLLEENLVIGKGQVIFSDYANGSDAVLENELAAMKNMEPDVLKTKLSSLFERWSENARPQWWVEQSLQKIARLLYVSNVFGSKGGQYKTNSELHEKIATAESLTALFPDVWSILKRMIPSLTTGDNTLELAEKVRDYLKNNYLKDISFDELAKELNFSSAYLSKIFKKHMRETPLKFLTQLRMAEAKRIIEEHPQYDIRLTAEMCGYLDQHYFCKVFKGVVGVTPSEYRQKYIDLP